MFETFCSMLYAKKQGIYLFWHEVERKNKLAARKVINMSEMSVCECLSYASLLFVSKMRQFVWSGLCTGGVAPWLITVPRNTGPQLRTSTRNPSPRQTAETTTSPRENRPAHITQPRSSTSSHPGLLQSNRKQTATCHL